MTKIVRLIGVYEKQGEDLIEEIVIQDNVFDRIKDYVKKKSDDPMFIDPYHIEAKDAYDVLIESDKQIAKYGFSEYDFYLECVTEL